MAAHIIDIAAAICEIAVITCAVPDSSPARFFDRSSTCFKTHVHVCAIIKNTQEWSIASEGGAGKIAPSRKGIVAKPSLWDKRGDYPSAALLRVSLLGN